MAWRMMADLPTVLMRRVGVSNFYIIPHNITRLQLDIYVECNLSTLRNKEHAVDHKEDAM